MDYTFERMTEKDVKAAAEIFDYFALNSFAVYSEEKKGKEFFESMKETMKRYPFYVIKAEDEKIVGFGSLRPYSPGKAFERAGMLTYFILPEHTKKGLGKKLLSILTEDAIELKIDTLLAHISSLNGASLAFHLKNGFKECGRFKRVGKKFDRDFDVVWMQRFI